MLKPVSHDAGNNVNAWWHPLWSS